MRHSVTLAGIGFASRAFPISFSTDGGNGGGQPAPDANQPDRADEAEGGDKEEPDSAGDDAKADEDADTGNAEEAPPAEPQKGDGGTGE